MAEAVVHLREVEPAIMRITLEDRVHKNTFSEGICAGLVSAFEVVKRNSTCKVVIVTGYDTYFCCGGTKEGLLDLWAGKSKFTDYPLYRLPLACDVPVIAAMQGHGIGGGLILGMFADFVVFSRESIYTANFMKYGFTPGFGSTLVLREKLGLPLAQEMLLTAASYRGAELYERGIAFPVVSRADVPAHALQLARQLADKPRRSLVTLKSHMTADLRSRLPAVAELEVLMHEQTLHQPEVVERIRTLFEQ
ncbi:MAG TPA: polyketide synthase [Steroidobacteraceae bacterium]